MYAHHFKYKNLTFIGNNRSDGRDLMGVFCLKTYQQLGLVSHQGDNMSSGCYSGADLVESGGDTLNKLLSTRERNGYVFTHVLFVGYLGSFDAVFYPSFVAHLAIVKEQSRESIISEEFNSNGLRGKSSELGNIPPLSSRQSGLAIFHFPSTSIKELRNSNADYVKENLRQVSAELREGPRSYGVSRQNNCQASDFNSDGSERRAFYKKIKHKKECQ